MGKIQHVGKQDSLLEILLCMLISHCFVWLREIRRKETRQWMVGIVGQDGVFGVCKWILKMQDSLLVVLGQVLELVVLVMGLGISQ